MTDNPQKPLRFASINIEHDRHYDKVIPFLKNFQADVICLQELYERDIDMFRSELGMECLFEPMLEMPTIMDDLSSSHTYFGLGILTNLPIIRHRADWYDGDKKTEVIGTTSEFTLQKC